MFWATETVRSVAGMVSVFPGAVLESSSVPDQPTTAQPSSGTAVSWIDAPGVKVPGAQPGELVGATWGSAPGPVWATVSGKQTASALAVAISTGDDLP